MDSRFRSLYLLFPLVLLAFGVLLWRLQITAGAAYYEKSQRSIAELETVPAARGKLLDCKGNILAQDQVSWTVVVGEDCDAAVRRRLRALCREAEVDWDGQGDILSPNALLLAWLQEEALEGVSLSPAVRRQGSGDLAPQLLGRVGAMSQAEWERYRDQGYALNELVGKDGAEGAFESLLHGSPGVRLVERDRQGQVTKRAYAQAPTAGQDVTLTLDRSLQAAARAALVEALGKNPQATGAAAVVLDVRDGGVLAMVSLPDYATEQFSQDYSTLAQDPNHPLLNRAIQGLYAPGSTFKLVTAAAALEEGVVTPETEILDTGRYTYYKTPQPQCWIFREEGRTHGPETLSQAIADSCNIFFYDAGRRLGIETLGRYAHALGLGEETGIALGGAQTGGGAGPAYTQSLGEKWYEGSVLSAAIGQENNRFTPLQLAHMTATLAGGGTRWQVHLLKKTAAEAYTPQPLGSLDLEGEHLEAIKAGMLAVTQEGSLAGAFRGLPVAAGAKTGSAQVAGAELANAVLVAFAPYEAPEVALAIVVEQGGSGTALGAPAAAILGAYFH